MPRPKFDPVLPPHITIGQFERRMEKVSMRQQRVAGVEYLSDLQKEIDATLAQAGTDYNVGG